MITLPHDLPHDALRAGISTFALRLGIPRTELRSPLPAAALRTLLLATALLLAWTRAAAQVPWESPQLLAPGTRAGMSVMYVDYGLSPNDGTGLLATFRPADVPGAFGLRFSATIPREDDVRVSGGIDVTVPMFSHSPALPLDVIWTSGLGLGYGDYYSVGLPVGVAASREISGDHILLRPYTSARVVIEGFFGDGRPEESFALALAADIGADIALQSSRWLIIRTAMSLGDRRALAVGLQIAPRGSPRTAALR